MDKRELVWTEPEEDSCDPRLLTYGEWSVKVYPAWLWVENSEDSEIDVDIVDGALEVYSCSRHGWGGYLAERVYIPLPFLRALLKLHDEIEANKCAESEDV